MATVVMDPELPIELHSSYLGHPDVPTTTAHLSLAPGCSETHVVEHDPGQLPVTPAR